MDTPEPESQPKPAPAWASYQPPSPASPALNPRELERTLADQRYLLHLVMGVLTVLLVTTTLALFHQIRWLAAQASQLKATSVELTKAVTEYETNTVPQLNRMAADFQRFAQTDPEFAKIMARYRLVQEPASTNSAPRPTSPSP